MSDMTYTRLGKSGLIVSRICLGTMTFTLGSDFFPGIARVGQDEATEMVAHAMDGGINFFDSADRYSQGDAETALGVALKGRREHAVICTKLGFRNSDAITDSGLSRRFILSGVEKALARLDTDFIDLLVVHRPDPTTPIEETLTALDTCVQHGKARYIGFSNWPAWQAARAVEFQRANGLAPFISGQMFYSPTARDLEVNVLPMMAEMDLSLMAWSPLAGGLLTGKYDPADLGSAQGRLASFDMLEIPADRARRVLEALNTVSGRHGASLPATALAWILAQRRDHTIIAGASRLGHLDDALAAPGMELSDEDITLITDAAPPALPYPESFGVLRADTIHEKALQ